MKIKPRLYLLVAATSALMPLQAQVDPNLKWWANPNRTTPNGNRVENSFYRFDGGTVGDCQNNAGNLPSVEVPTGSSQWRVNKPFGRKRAELAQTLGDGTDPLASYQPAEGVGFYIGYRWKMTSTTPLNGTGVTVFQWKSAAAGNLQDYPLYASYNGSNLSFSMVGAAYNGGVGTPSINDYTTKIWTKPVAPDTWVNLVIYIYPSRTNGSGLVRIYFNGALQTLTNTKPLAGVTLSTDGKTAKGRTWEDGGVYCKWGAYNGATCPFDITAYLERMRIGTTFDSVNPANYTN